MSGNTVPLSLSLSFSSLTPPSTNCDTPPLVHNFVPQLQLTDRIESFLSQGSSFKLEDANATATLLWTPRSFQPRTSPASKFYYSDSIDLDLVSLANNSNLLATLDQQQRLQMANQRILRALLEEHDATLVPSDKNMGLCIISNSDYQSAMSQFLATATDTFLPSTEEEVKKRALMLHQHLYKNSILQALNTNSPPSEALRASQPITVPQLYGLLKIHKSPMAIRPIVSTNDTCMAKLDQHLLKQLEHLLKCIKNADFITTTVLHSQEAQERLSNMLQQGHVTSIQTGDVTELYNKLQHFHILDAIRYWRRQTHFTDFETTPLIRDLQALLNNLCCQFIDRFFIQPKGIPMGARLSPHLATLTLTYIEHCTWRTIRANCQLSHHLQPGHCAVRYLDDVATDPRFFRALQHSYSLFNLKLVSTSEPTDSQAVFLDLVLSVDHNTRSLVTDLHIKKNKANTYLHWNSSNPRSHYRSIVFGFVHRLLRCCNQPARQLDHLHAFKQQLLDRAYPLAFVNDTLAEALIEVPKRISARKLNPDDELDEQPQFLPVTQLPLITDRDPPIWFTVSHLVQPLRPLIPLSNYGKIQLHQLQPR